MRSMLGMLNRRPSSATKPAPQARANRALQLTLCQAVLIDLLLLDHVKFLVEIHAMIICV